MLFAKALVCLAKIVSAMGLCMAAVSLASAGAMVRGGGAAHVKEVGVVEIRWGCVVILMPLSVDSWFFERVCSD